MSKQTLSPDRMPLSPRPSPAVLPKTLAPLLDLTERTRNLLLVGPPGTGKTWLAQHFAHYFLLYHNASPERAAAYWQAVLDGEGETLQTLRAEAQGGAERTASSPPMVTLAFVTFHQSFAYEEFVEGIRPQVSGGQIHYPVRPGLFRTFCEAAQHQPDKRFLLIIDEINRANIAKVLGELITLLEDDKRLGMPNETTVTLPYSKQRFGVPQNLTLLGTMNTADRSIALLDLALRRRFAFVECMPDPSLLSPVAGVDLGALLTRLNRRIVALLDREHQIGHSYLLNVKDVAQLRFVWAHRLLPLLQEVFYNDGERLQAVLGREFVKTIPPEAGLFDAALDRFDTDAPRYALQTFPEDDAGFLAALRRLSGAPAPPARQRPSKR